MTNVYSTDTFPAPLLKKGSISQTDAGLMDDPLVLEETLTSLAAAGEAATLSGSIVGSHANPHMLGLQSHSTSCSSMSSQDSSRSTCRHNSRQLSLSDVNEGPSAAARQWADAHGAVQRASGLLQEGDVSMQSARALHAGLSAEPVAESMLASPTSPFAEHSGGNHQTLKPAQQTPEKHPMLPLGGVADSSQRVSLPQTRAGLQAHRAGSEMQKTPNSSQQPHAQVQSTDTTITGGETELAAAGGDATLAGGDATPAEVS